MSIYKLICKDNTITEFYVGSTKDIKNRMRIHKLDCENKKLKLYNYINENGGWDNWTYEIIKEVDVDDRKKYEIEQIELLKPTLNSVKPFLGTTAEYRKSKQWREKCRNHAQKETTKQKRRERDTKNREKLREQIYNYRHANPDKFIIYSERYNVPVECECGTIIINKAKLPRHRKTAKHIKLMKNN